MPRPTRSEQFQSIEIGIVHTVQRCVRRAFLAGVDDTTGEDFSFRCEWIRRRMESLASVFGIDVLTYAIMSNHVHRQDDCTGRFWEGRFKALRIVDEGGLLACAMYVDLNPVRAAMAESPDQSPHTSAYDRIHGIKGETIERQRLTWYQSARRMRARRSEKRR